MEIFYILSVLVSMVLAYILMPKVLLISYKKKLFDLPSARKVHQTPIPRLGGITFFPIVLITFFFVIGIRYTMFGFSSLIPLSYLFKTFIAFFIGMTVLFLIGVADDLISVSYRSKFLVQILAASFFPLSGLSINNFGGIFGIYEVPWIVSYFATVLCVVCVTNAINLIDGIDGLASGLSIISLFFLGVLCRYFHHYTYLFLVGSIFGVLLIFFFYNVFGRAENRRKIFMGDTGSLTLGYTISFILIHLLSTSYNYNPWENGHAVIAMSTVFVPIFDVVRVVITRVRDGRHPFMPDKNHIHHKLLRTGLNKIQTMAMLLCISVFMVVSNMFLVRFVNYNFVIIIDLLLWTSINVLINYFIRRHEKTSGSIFHIAYVPDASERNAVEKEKEEEENKSSI